MARGGSKRGGARKSGPQKTVKPQNVRGGRGGTAVNRQTRSTPRKQGR